MSSTAPAPAPAVAPDLWTGTGFRPDIQGLRAIAVMLVLLSHAGFGWARGGYIGVDVFFVVSGFLITSLLVKEFFATGTISIPGFFSRRARRILPAATVVTIVTAVWTWLWFPVTRFEAVMGDAVAVITYVVNYRFVIQETEYLNTDALPSPFQQYWSLAVEEQYYLIWPLILLCVLLLARGNPQRALRFGIICVSTAFVASLVASILITASSQPTAYYATHTRVWELAGGAFLAMTLPTWRRVPEWAALLCGVVGLVAVIGAGFRYDDNTAFPGYAALAPVLGTMLLIVAGTAHASNLVSSALSTQPFQFVGKISYSLYLWHWPILVLIPLALGVDASLPVNIGLLIVAFVAAQLSYTFIETPVRAAKGRPTSYGLTVGAACMALGLATVLVLTFGVSKVPDGEADVDLTTVEVVPGVAQLEDQLTAGLLVQQVPDKIEPGLAHVDDDSPITYENDCHLGFAATTPPGECAYGDPDSDVTVILFGDSHAAQWFPALESIAQNRGWRLLSRTKSACTPASVHVESTSHEGEYIECWDWKREVFDEIDQIRPDLVVVSGTDEAPIMGFGTSGGNAEWATGWARTLERVDASAGRVVTLTDTPRATGARAPDCSSMHMDSADTCLRDDPYALSGVPRREAAVVAQQSAGATVVDTVDWFCVSEGCPLIVEDLLVYRDEHHISTPYAQFLSRLLAKQLPRLKQRSD